MPTYVYKCEVCAETFDVTATIKQKEAGLEPACPACRAHKTRQVLTAGLVLVGGGHGAAPAPSCGCGSEGGCCQA
ncbi:MAG: hypothetical protein JNK29_09460 [Anaerolineales bacterium]|nr:hypothetical protein [Anaerolineales bacterium]